MATTNISDAGERAEGNGIDPGMRIDRLRNSFVTFRREHKPGTRIPDSLRNGVFAAIAAGASAAEVRRACDVTASQLAQWRAWKKGSRQPGKGTRQEEPQFFPVVDSGQFGQELELRLGGWSVCVRQVEG